MTSPGAKLDALYAQTGLLLCQVHASFVKRVLVLMNDPAEMGDALHCPILRAMVGSHHAETLTWQPLWVLAAIVLTDPTIDQPSLVAVFATTRICRTWFAGLIDVLKAIPGMSLERLDSLNTDAILRYSGRDITVHCLAANGPDQRGTGDGTHLLLLDERAPLATWLAPLWSNATHCVSFFYTDQAPTYTAAELGEEKDEKGP